MSEEKETEEEEDKNSEKVVWEGVEEKRGRIKKSGRIRRW